MFVRMLLLDHRKLDEPGVFAITPVAAAAASRHTSQHVAIWQLTFPPDECRRLANCVRPR